MHEINDLGYCVCNVMEDAVIEEESDWKLPRMKQDQSILTRKWKIL